MSLAWLRRSSRLVAGLVLLASLWQLPHRAEDDRICAPGAAEAHDESKHVFTAADGAGHQDHCAVCHWLRSIKPGFSSSMLAAVPTDAGRRLIPLTAGGLRDPGSDRRPARAPPSLLS